jgi:hypothetical protein
MAEVWSFFEPIRGFIFLSSTEGSFTLQTKRSKQLYHVEVEFQSGLIKIVKIKAANRPTAERRALKFHPSAIRVKRDAT